VLDQAQLLEKVNHWLPGIKAGSEQLDREREL